MMMHGSKLGTLSQCFQPPEVGANKSIFNLTSLQFEKNILPFSLSFALCKEVIRSLIARWGICLEIKLPHFIVSNRCFVALQVHDAIGSGMGHLAVVEQLACLEHTVAPPPSLNVVPPLVKEAVAVWVLDGEGTETDVVSGR